MTIQLLEAIEEKQSNLNDIFDENNKICTSDAVLKASQELDQLIVAYLMEKMKK